MSNKPAQRKSKTPSKNGGKAANGRFAKGNTFGKNGRPEGSRNKVSLDAEVLLDGEAEAITRKAIEMALAGDAVALRLCLERILPPRKDRAVLFDIPPIKTSLDAVGAISNVLECAGRGELTVAQAKDLAAVIEIQRRTIEHEDLERRIAALEEQQHGR